MKTFPLLLTLGALTGVLSASDAPVIDHATQAEALAEVQDNLSADVQQLVIEQTNPRVIELLGSVEDIMDEVVEKLAEGETGGETLAAQTEIIEKIHKAAQEKQKQQGGSGSGGAMMDMMERMMGKPKDGDGPAKDGQGAGGGNQAGQGNGGESDSAPQSSGGPSTGKREIRRVPKAAGKAGTEIPAEFRKAFDAYNRGLESNLK
jgi:hypothetical protein